MEDLDHIRYKQKTDTKRRQQQMKKIFISPQKYHIVWQEGSNSHIWNFHNIETVTKEAQNSVLSSQLVNYGAYIWKKHFSDLNQPAGPFKYHYIISIITGELHLWRYFTSTSLLGFYYYYYVIVYFFFFKIVIMTGQLPGNLQPWPDTEILCFNISILLRDCLNTWIKQLAQILIRSFE